MGLTSDPRKRRSSAPAVSAESALPTPISRPPFMGPARTSQSPSTEPEAPTNQPEQRLTRLFVPAVKVRAPDPAQDFGTYRALDQMLQGVHEICEKRRSGFGSVGHAATNGMSDLTKAAIDATVEGDDADAAEYLAQCERLESDFKNVRLPDDLARFLPEGYDAVIPTTNQFLNTLGQERMEANLFARIWPVVIGKAEVVPALPTLRESNTNIPQVMSGIVDTVSEISKALDDEVSERLTTIGERLRVTDRFLRIASSIELRLAQERHHPGNVIDNGWGHWNRFSSRIRKQVQAVIAFKKRDKAMYLSFLEIKGK